MFQKRIEDFWGCLKQKVYDRRWATKSILELKKRIRYCLKKIDQKFVQDLALTTRKRLINYLINFNTYILYTI